MGLALGNGMAHKGMRCASYSQGAQIIIKWHKLLIAKMEINDRRNGNTENGVITFG